MLSKENVLDSNTWFTGLGLIVVILMQAYQLWNSYQFKIKTTEHQIKFSQSHKKRADVIEELNHLILEAQYVLNHYIDFIVPKTAEERIKENSDVSMTTAAFFSYFDRNRIYLPKHLDRKIEELYISFTDAQFAHISARSAGNSKLREKYHIQTWDKVNNEIPQLRRELEKEFRRILDP